MKVVFNLIIFLFFVSNICISQGRGDQIFDESYVHEIRITTELDFEELMELYLDGLFSGDFTYTPSSVTIDGNSLDSVGLRIKGGSSAFDAKKPLKLDFNSFVPGQRYDGLKKLNLHQGNRDQSFMREAITYGLFRNAGVHTVRTSFANIYVNDVYEGVYTLVEQIDDNFIKNRFASNEGALYKTGFDGLNLKYEVENPLPYDDFEAVVNQIPTALLHEQLPVYLDVESYLRLFATHIFVNGVDGPLTVDYNYYIYYEPKAGKYVYIPWDYNLSLYGGANYPLFPFSENFIFPRIPNNPILKQRYLDVFCDLFEYNFDGNRLDDLITTYQELLKDDVPNDPYLDQSGDWESGVQMIRDVLNSRITSLTTELNTNFGECIPLSNPIEPIDVVINEIVASNNMDSGINDPNGDAADWIELYNNTDFDVNLTGLYLSNDKDVLKHWRFPENTLIAANDYLIVWADRDLDEEGLHTSFKLNKTNDALYLSFENGEIIDEVIFADQSTNIGWARVPNGTGEFMKQNATFNGPNSLISSTKTNFSELEWSISPNPISRNNVLQVQSTISTASKVQIIDMYGKLLWQDDIRLSVGMNQINCPSSQFKTGVYTLQLIDPTTKERSSQKLVIF